MKLSIKKSALFSLILLSVCVIAYAGPIVLYNSSGTEIGTATNPLEVAMPGDILSIEQIGVGTTNPQEELHVVGSIMIEDNSNQCTIVVDTDDTCDSGTKMAENNSVAICLICE